MGDGAVAAALRDRTDSSTSSCLLYIRHEFVLLQFFNEIRQRSVTLEGIDFRVRIAKEESAGIQRLGIKEGEQCLHPGQQCRILRRICERIDLERYMITGSGRTVALLLHMVAAGTDHTGNSGE